MGFLADRKGNLSWFRISILALVIGLGFVMFGYISFQLDQQSRRSPYFPALPPGATQWGLEEPLGSGYQRVFYRVADGDVEAVATFYQNEMGSYYGTSATSLEQCRRLPPQGEFTNLLDQQRPANDGKIYNANFVPGRDLPYLYKCLFDRNGFNSIQDTLVYVQPGLANSDPELDTEGDVVIIYEQHWQN